MKIPPPCIRREHIKFDESTKKYIFLGLTPLTSWELRDTADYLDELNTQDPPVFPLNRINKSK